MSNMNYYLRKNPLSTSDENRYMACVSKKDTLRQSQVVEHMLKRNTTVSRQDIIVVLDLLKETVIDLVTDGFPVIMDLFKARAGIKGGFTSLEDEFDKNRHRVSLNLNAAPSFKKELTEKAAFEKASRMMKKPELGQVYDYRTRSVSTELNAGSLISLTGRQLLPEEGDPRVFLRAEGAEDLIEITDLHDVTERRILCSLPEDLAAGTYILKVVTGEGDEEVNVVYGESLSIS